MDKNFNVRPQTIKIIEENIGSKILDMAHSNILPMQENKRKKIENGTISN